MRSLNNHLHADECGREGSLGAYGSVGGCSQ